MDLNRDAMLVGLHIAAWSGRLSGNDDLVSWSTRTGAYAYMRVTEEHERLMRGD